MRSLVGSIYLVQQTQKYIFDALRCSILFWSTGKGQLQ